MRELKPINQSVCEIYQTLNVRECAAAMGIHISTAYPYAEPKRETIPVDRLIRLLAFSSSSGQEKCVTANYNLVSHFSNAAKIKIYDESVLKQLNICVEALSNGGRLKGPSASCPECYAALKHKGWLEGMPIYVCEICHGSGTRMNQ